MVGIWSIVLTKRWILAEEMRQRPDEVNKIVVRKEPRAKVRNGDGAGGINERMMLLEDRTTRKGEEDSWRKAGVILHEPEGEKQIVPYSTTGIDRDGALGAEEHHRPTVVMGEGAGVGTEGGKCTRESSEMVVDVPPGVISIRQRRGAAVRKRGCQELVHLSVRCRRDRCRHSCSF